MVIIGIEFGMVDWYKLCVCVIDDVVGLYVCVE